MVETVGFSPHIHVLFMLSRLLDYISQAPVQLGTVISLSSSRGSADASDICHYGPQFLRLVSLCFIFFLLEVLVGVSACGWWAACSQGQL